MNFINEIIQIFYVADVLISIRTPLMTNIYNKKQITYEKR